MPKITTTTVLAGVAGAAAVTLAGFGANAALAESTPSPSISSSATAGEQPGSQGHGGPGGMGHGRGAMKGADASQLATALGLSEDKVSAAIEKVREANKPTERPAAGTQPSESEREARRTAYISALAKELGVSTDKVTAAMETVRAEHDKERTAQLTSRLDEAVKAGKLTAADKASVLKAFEAGVLGGGPR